jgi:hypothetical protein
MADTGIISLPDTYIGSATPHQGEQLCWSPWPRGGRGFGIFPFLVVLADDAGSRALPVWQNGPEGCGYDPRGHVASSGARPGCPGSHPGRAGGPWLCSTLVRSLFQAVVVPSGFSTRVQPCRWIPDRNRPVLPHGHHQRVL